MRLTVRPGSDPIARTDATILAAMGLPGGGVVRIGRTHVLVRPGDVPGAAAIALGPRTLTNAGVKMGSAADIVRVNPPRANRVVLSGEGDDIDARHAARALQGLPVTTGDSIALDPTYGTDDGDDPPHLLDVLEVVPGGFGLVGDATVVGPIGEGVAPGTMHTEGLISGDSPTTAEALLAGLDAELDVMTGWLSLLTSAGNLPEAWGLPRVAGVLLAGPAGCGKSELVAKAAARVGASVQEISLELVFKPEKLLDVLEKGLRQAMAPTVLFIDRLDSVAGDEGMFRTQTSAIMRWFLDAVGDKPRIACVLGVSTVSSVDASVRTSPLLPKSLTIPPPDLARRRMLFDASLARVPSEEVDLDTLAARSAGFSGADVVAAVVHASAMAAGSNTKVTTQTLVDAVADTTPSLGSVPTGEMPSYGFERVANLDTVKQRLTEAVIWPMTDPERFTRLGIDPPRGILLYGPPGTGKTFVIRALAHESGAAFFSIKGAELLDKYVGESERGVREVFARARVAAPAILFFDELDALAPVRGRSTTSVTDSVVAALLTELDGVGERGDVVVIGATNRRDLIDPALLRGGRFESHIHLGLPEASARRALFGVLDIPYGDDVDLDQVAEATDGLSFADLSGMLREAALTALRRDPTAITVSRADIDAALTSYRERSSG